MSEKEKDPSDNKNAPQAPKGTPIARPDDLPRPQVDGGGA